MVFQVDEHGRKHQFIIHQTADSGELSTAQIQQILMSQQAFPQQPVKIQSQVSLAIIYFSAISKSLETDLSSLYLFSKDKPGKTKLFEACKNMSLR